MLTEKDPVAQMLLWLAIHERRDRRGLRRWGLAHLEVRFDIGARLVARAIVTHTHRRIRNGFSPIREPGICSVSAPSHARFSRR